MPPFKFDPDYARRYVLCKAYATDGACSRPSCFNNHTIIDTARVLALVGDPPAPKSGGTLDADSEKIYFSIEYTKYSSISDGADPEETKWRLKLLAGGRATMPAGGLGTGDSAGSLSVQPVYPVKGISRDAGVALGIIERRVFGRTPAPDPVRPQVCRHHLDEHCRFSASNSCRYSHTMFDMARVDTLMAEAVSERGYKDYKPRMEIEYVGKSGEKPMWRVTLRCVVGYAQKGVPEPVVVTATDLGTAFRLLERQFAGSAGKPPPPQACDNAHAHGTHRRANTSTPRSGRGHTRTNSTPQPSRSSPPHQQDHTRPGAFRSPPPAASYASHPPPPSYHEAMRGNNTQPHGYDSKHRGV